MVHNKEHLVAQLSAILTRIQLVITLLRKRDELSFDCTDLLKQDQTSSYDESFLALPLK